MSSNQKKIILKDVKKIYQVHSQKSSSVFELVTKFFKKKTSKELVALDSISLEVYDGEMLGVLGKNGSGKTTLLKLMAGIIEPTKGKITVNGKISPFLALGSGFHPELNAKENVMIYGLLLGATKQEITKNMDNILKFAELEDYSEVKLKDFSSGMLVRLAFSVAVSIEPDIILIDEILAVGDASFQEKCLQKMLSFKKSGKAMVLVTHNMDQVAQICDRAVLIHKGHIENIGSPQDVVESYKKIIQ